MCVSKRLKVLSKCELLLSGFEKDVSGAPAMSSKKNWWQSIATSTELSKLD